MIGIDLVEIARVELRDSFLNTVLTEEERKEYEELKADKRRKEYVAGRFASKEAIFKVTQDPAYLHYSILHDESGKPYVRDHPELEISIAHDGGMAVAVVHRE